MIAVDGRAEIDTDTDRISLNDVQILLSVELALKMATNKKYGLSLFGSVQTQEEVIKKLRDVLKKFAEVEGNITIRNGIAWLPDRTTINLKPYQSEPSE